MFHNYPYTDFHELNLDKFLEKFNTLLNDFSNLQDELDEYIKGLDIPNDYIDLLNKNRILNDAGTQYDIAFYIDTVNGNDDNTGRSADDPMKTIGATIQKASLLYNDIRIHLITSGTYEVDFLTMANGSLHIFAEADNITIFSPHDIRFYNMHLNIQGIGSGFNFTIEGAGDNAFYLDSGDITAINTTFNCLFRLNGAWGTASGSTFRNMYINASPFTFSSGCIIRDKYINDAPAIRAVNASIFNTQPLTINLSANQSGDFAVIYGGVFTITPTLEVTGSGTYAGDFIANHCNIILADSVRAAIHTIVNDIVIGPLVNTPDLITTTLQDNSTVVTVDTWTTLQEITDVPAGNYLVLCSIRGTGTHDPANIRVVTSSGTVYGNVLFNAGGVWSNMIAVQRSTEQSTITVSVQYASGTTVRVNTKLIKV